MIHIVNMFGRWTKRTQVEASRKKHLWEKVLSRQRAAAVPESPSLALDQELLPKGWVVNGNSYVHLLLGDTRPLEDPPTRAISNNADQVFSRGLPRPSDIQAIARGFEATLNVWLRAFDRVYLESGDLLAYDPEDDSFKVAVCIVIRLLDEYCCEVLKSRLVKEHDPNCFDWQEHYVSQSIMSTPNKITKETLLEHIQAMGDQNASVKKSGSFLKRSSPILTNLNKLWNDKKAVAATQNLIVELYKLRAVCELCEQPRHRLLIETLGLLLPLNLDGAIHKVVKSPSLGYTAKRTSGSMVTVLFPAIALPSSSNAIVVPALVL